MVSRTESTIRLSLVTSTAYQATDYAASPGQDGLFR